MYTVYVHSYVYLICIYTKDIHEDDRREVQLRREGDGGGTEASRERERRMQENPFYIGGIYVYICVCLYIYICIYMSMYMLYISRHIYNTYKHTYTHIHIHIHLCMYVCYFHTYIHTYRAGIGTGSSLGGGGEICCGRDICR